MLDGVGRQRMARTNKGHFYLQFDQWEPLGVTIDDSYCSLVACTNKCGWAIRSILCAWLKFESLEVSVASYALNIL